MMWSDVGQNKFYPLLAQNSADTRNSGACWFCLLVVECEHGLRLWCKSPSCRNARMSKAEQGLSTPKERDAAFFCGMSFPRLRSPICTCALMSA